MKFVYKIWSGYDGFTPSKIEERMSKSGLLELSWIHYIDHLEKGNEIWIYFYGPGSFEPGVYVKGRAHRIDPDAQVVTLQVSKRSLGRPLAMGEMAERIGELVKVRYRQVFPVPLEWRPAASCTALSTADSCKEHRCQFCPRWENEFPQALSYGPPERLVGRVEEFATGYWAIPPRCFLGTYGLKPGIRLTSDLFYSFKWGQKNLAYPLALALIEGLQAKGRDSFDAIVPVPISPEKAESGEFHRTLALAKELSGLLGAPVCNCLNLSHPVSKRVLRNQGLSAVEFERLYKSYLRVGESLLKSGHVLLIDDVATYGSTLRVCAEAIQANSSCQVVAGTAALMIRVTVAPDKSELLEAA